jgi:hypothetical protein
MSMENDGKGEVGTRRRGDAAISLSSLSTFSSSHIIRASEIGQYAYCARAWWLGSMMGVPSSNGREMAQGKAMHWRHGLVVLLSGVLRLLAILLLVVAAVFAAIIVLIS